MSEKAWHHARLIPTSGISGAEEQERRATSALLAVMSIVKEFGRQLLSRAGAPAGRVETYIEVPFDLADQRVIPDGLISVTRGARSWTALVEVKTGRNQLRAEQLEKYLEVAKGEGFDALITISNELVSIPGQHPTVVDRRKLRKVEMHHWSWASILSAAVMQKEHHGVSDPEQAWILGELIRYLEHPKSGALEFEDMGPRWVAVRDAVKAGTLRAGDASAAEVASRFDALLRFASLRLGMRLGTEVRQVMSRKEMEDPNTRVQSLVKQLVDEGVLTGALRIADAVGPLHLRADLRAHQVTAYVDIDAPKTGRNATRVNWLVRQLKNAPEGLRMESYAVRARGAGAAELLSKVRDDPAVLVLDRSKELKSFRVALTVPMGRKMGRGRGSFIDSCLDVVDEFYGSVVQSLRPWSPPAPKLREQVVPEGEPEELTSASLSSQDGPAV